jgi:hypothetical protein
METIGVMAAGLAHEITPPSVLDHNSTFVKETIDKLVQFITSVRDLMHDMTRKFSANPRAIDDIIDEFEWSSSPRKSPRRSTNASRA